MQMLTNWLQAGCSVTALIIPRLKLAWLNPEDTHNRRIIERNNYDIDLGSFIVHRLDDLLRDTVAFCLDSKALEVDTKISDFFDSWAGKNMSVSARESALLKLIRTKKFQQVAIKLKNGQPIFLTAQQELAGAKLEEIVGLIQEHKYQSVHVNCGTQGFSISRELKLKTRGSKLQ